MFVVFLFCPRPNIFFFFFFNDTATTEIYTLSLHDALPIYRLPNPDGWLSGSHRERRRFRHQQWWADGDGNDDHAVRSEEHTSELQSQSNLVCRLLLAKKNSSASAWPNAATRAATGTVRPGA